MPETPFEFHQTPYGWIGENQSQSVTVISEVPCKVGRRRGRSIGSPTCAEMAFVEIADGVRVFVRQYENGHVDVTITRRIVNP